MPDEKNRISLACRTLLVEPPDGRKILFETGVGAFFEPKLRSRFGIVESDHVLLSALADHGLGHEDIDVVVLSHLHFDHAGGLLSAWRDDHAPDLLFPQATYLTSRAAFERATVPHFRDRASFIPALNALLATSGRLSLVEPGAVTHEALGDGFRFHHSDGHTPGMLLTEIRMPSGPILFAADLIPGTPWVHLPITMGYDRFPERLIEEKEALLTQLLAREGRLFFTHDSTTALASINRDERGRYVAVDPVPSLHELSQ